MNLIEDKGITEYSKMLATRYRRFQSPTGIGGLYRRDGKRIDFLAVHATREGKGEFREFIRCLKLEYTTICVWVINNQILKDALTRYGFTDEVEIQGDGEPVHGKRWDR